MLKPSPLLFLSNYLYNGQVWRLVEQSGLGWVQAASLLQSSCGDAEVAISALQEASAALELRALVCTRALFYVRRGRHTKKGTVYAARQACLHKSLRLASHMPWRLTRLRVSA